jgi:RNA polymerase sigma-70 factor (ECF subfamily)
MIRSVTVDQHDAGLASIADKASSSGANVARTTQLLTLVRNGDEDAFEELFNRHRRRVALIAGRFFHQREQIEEMVQETFAKVYFALDSYAHSESDDDALFAAWIARIAFNTCLDELRRMKRRPEHFADDLSADETGWLENRLQADSSRNAESTSISRDLAHKLLARLSPEDRLVLVLLNAEELSVNEIARLMGWSASKVKVRAHRARAALRRVLRKLL